jgi:hypothetical protein
MRTYETCATYHKTMAHMVRSSLWHCYLSILDSERTLVGFERLSYSQLVVKTGDIKFSRNLQSVSVAEQDKGIGESPV